MRWVVVAFDHPGQVRSLVYRQDVQGTAALLKAVETAAEKGANLLSIRGFADVLDSYIGGAEEVPEVVP